jgi:hypothetical protein
VGMGLHRDQILFVWTRLVAKLLKNLVLLIYPFFSSGADSHGAEIVVVVSGGSSPSIGELGPDIDKLDEIWREGTSIVHTCDVSIHGRTSTASAKKAGRRSSCEGKKALLKDALGKSNV